MDALKQKAAAAASAGASAAQKGAAAAAPHATAAADKAMTAAKSAGGAAKDAAMKNEQIADLVDKHGDKAEVAKDAAVGALKKAFTPSKEMQDFAKNPTQEQLMANPELLFQGIALMNSVRHPKAAIFNGMVQEGMERAVASQDKAEKAAQGAINATMGQATGGVVNEVPPEVSGAAMKFLKENPKEAMEMMKMAASLKK
jgi:hypothetical protein